jgi:hypothetical protein
MRWEWTGTVVREVFAGSSNAEEESFNKVTDGNSCPPPVGDVVYHDPLFISSHLHGNQPNDAKSRRASLAV